MASRYWVAKWTDGYAGSEDEEAIDLIVDWNYSKEEVEAMTDGEAGNIISDYAYEMAVVNCEGWAKPLTQEEYERTNYGI